MSRQRSINDFFAQSEPLAKLRRIDVDQLNDADRDEPNTAQPMPGKNTRTSRYSTQTDTHVVHFKPSSTFHFPKQTDGSNRGRSVQHSWFQSFEWLHYDLEKDSLFCFTCIKCLTMLDKSMLQEGELAFLKVGFRNWRNATTRLAQHEKSALHLRCVDLIIRRENAIPVHVQLQNSLSKTQKQASRCLLVIFSSLKYLALTGCAIRGLKQNGGNLIELLKERQMDVPELKPWLQRRNNYLSPDIQNEILEIMAHEVQTKVVIEIQAAPWFSVIVDGTTDVGSLEQLSICARHANNSTLGSEEKFLGLYNADDSRAETITAVTKDVLVRLNLPLEKLRGHCFDGAANMSGCRTGVRVRLQQEQPKSLYVHCANHSLDLVLQEVAKQNNGVCDVLCMIRQSSNCILDSASRQKMFEKVVLSPCHNSSDEDGGMEEVPAKQLLPFCPTRWCARVPALKRYKQNYSQVLETLDQISNCGTITADRKSAIRGWINQLKKFKTLFYLNVSLAIFAPCEEVARVLQSPNLTATGAKQAADRLTCMLQKLRSDEEFDHIFETTVSESQELDLDPLEEPRVRRPPKRFDFIPNAAPSVQLSAKDTLRKEYFEILDLQISELNERFDQEGFSVLVSFENILLDAARGKVIEETELKEKLGIFVDDFDVDRLHTQLGLLKTVPEISSNDCSTLAGKLSKESETVQKMLDQVILLLTLIITVPASAASAERSFSALRRMKTYLRSTMTQDRLTHLMLLHVHREKTAELDLNLLMQKFVAKCERRKSVFGKIV